jgi:hypothetical protein
MGVDGIDPLGLDYISYEDFTIGTGKNRRKVTKVFYTPEGFMGIDGTRFYVGQINADNPTLIKVGTHPQASWLPLNISRSKVEEIASEWFSGIKTNNDLMQRLGVRKNENMIKPIGFVESLIPVYGPIRLMDYEARRGGGMANAVPYALLAFSDLFLIRSLATGIGKVGWKAFTNPGWIKQGWTTQLTGAPFHVIWSSGKEVIHARGTYLAMEVTEEGAKGWTRVTSRWLSFPVLSKDLAMIKGGHALFCFSGSFNAISRGNFHIIPYILPRLKFKGNNKQIFNVPYDATGVPTYHYNPETAQWEPLMLLNSTNE